MKVSVLNIRCGIPDVLNKNSDQMDAVYGNGQRRSRASLAELSHLFLSPAIPFRSYLKPIVHGEYALNISGWEKE